MLTHKELLSKDTFKRVTDEEKYLCYIYLTKKKKDDSYMRNHIYIIKDTF